MHILEEDEGDEDEDLEDMVSSAAASALSTARPDTVTSADQYPGIG